MSFFSQQSPWQAEWNRLQKREQRYLERAAEREASLLERQLKDKVPGKLRETMDAAFRKAFSLLFEKGTGVIEKTCARPRREYDFQVRQYAADLREDKKALRAFPKAAGAAGRKNLLLSGVEGVGLGLLGIGLPDIPLFTGVLLKSVYEIALSYGCGYETPEERIFVLRVISGALSRGERLLETDRALNGYMEAGQWAAEDTVEAEIDRTAGCLSGELLYMKFLQGVPLVGAVGGAWDAVYLNRVQAYARLKYYRRFLLKRRRESAAGSGRGG